MHARYYADTFRVKPDSGISTENLKLAIGHAPVDKNGFLAGQPELLKVEKVNETELEGYKIYQEAMGN